MCFTLPIRSISLGASLDCWVLVPVLCLVAALPAQGQKPKTLNDPVAVSGQTVFSDAAKAPDESVSAAIAPVVYNDDERPGARGYRYTFFGNAFFINEQGYLLTVAHVLETFSNGGQASIVVSHPNAPPQLLQVTIVAKDPEHDVAILRAMPNPFGSRYSVSFVPLSSSQAVRGESVLALSLHPKQIQNAHSFELSREDFSPGTVLSFESTQLAKSGPGADVFLLSHPVVKGQSGSPVLDTQTHAVVGLVEGLWMRGSSSSVGRTSSQTSTVPGVAIPIRYAVALLEENSIAWHAVAPADSAATLSPANR